VTQTRVGHQMCSELFDWIVFDGDPFLCDVAYSLYVIEDVCDVDEICRCASCAGAHQHAILSLNSAKGQNFEIMSEHSVTIR